MPESHTRRSVLKISGAGLAVGAFERFVGEGEKVREGHVAAADEFDALRAKWRDMLTGGAAYDPTEQRIAHALTISDGRARGYWERMNKTPERTALWSDLQSGTSETSYLTGTYNRLADMARAYATRGSMLAGNATLLADTIGGLDWMYAHEYNEKTTMRGNWWDWEIGSPLALNNASVLLFDQLSAEQIASYARAVGTFTPVADLFYGGKTISTGANRVWKAEGVAIRAALVHDAAKLAHVRDSLSDVFPFVTSGDGFYADGSFIQHGKHPYTGGYGISLLTEIGNLLYFLGNSPWAVTDPQQQNIFDAVTRSFVPVIAHGAMMDMVRGREISRFSNQDHVAGHAAIRAILTLAQVAPADHATAFTRAVKGWIQRDTYRDFFANAPLTAILQACAILDDPMIAPADEPVTHRQFPRMDRVVHSRPRFAFGISMSSARIFTYESINRENLRAWYTGDGMTYLYNDDLAQFSDDFWATVNPYRLPGTTIDTHTRADGSGQSKAPTPQWAGGATLRGMAGAVGMDLAAFESTLVAKKSWFLIEDAIIALGAGITSADNRPIETIIENRKLHAPGDNALVVDGATKPGDMGWTETLPNARWATLDGAGGYVFPGTATIQGSRMQHSGAWSDLNKSTNQPPVSRPYLTLWFDHGTNPTNATYAYILLPNASADATRAYAAIPDATILVNSADVQAIRVARLGITGANFWKPGSAEFIHASAPLSIMAQEEEGVLTLALSDPTHTQQTLSLELDRAATAILTSDPSITVTQLAPTIKLNVRVAGMVGATQTVTLTLVA